MGASGAKYGIMTSHFYWLGAIPAMVFVGIFMMPFYYGSKARSVPEYLKLRFDEKTRGFNALTFAFMTVFSSGISMHVLALLMQTLLGWSYDFSLLGLGQHRPGLHRARRPDLGHLQRSAAVLSDRAGFLAAGFPWPHRRGRLERPGGEAQQRRRQPAVISPARGPTPGGTWAAPTRTRWAWSGSAWSWAWASCSRSAIGAPTSWSCSGRWPPIRCRPRGGRR